MRRKSLKLSDLTNGFILRRTADILNKYLPSKVEQVIFCSLSTLQNELYKAFLRKKRNTIFSGKSAALACISRLRKLCNHPSLIYDLCRKKVSFISKDSDDSTGDEDEETGFANTENLFPQDFDENVYQPHYSGKMQVLDHLLNEIHKKTDDKVVLISNSTKMLDLFEKMCQHYKYPFMRLDGQTQNEQRQILVDRFNSSSNRGSSFLFLLSTRAGGVGLNLIGANRLILFDSDWNPANDKQAMARVWRDGQRKTVWVYRLLSTGTMEEKIFQRQITKQGLSRSIIDGTKSDRKNSFSQEELKDLFTLYEETLCDTHDLLGCGACLEDFPLKSLSVPKSNFSRLPNKTTSTNTKSLSSELSNWTHCFCRSSLIDPLLRSISFVTEELELLETYANAEKRNQEAIPESLRNDNEDENRMLMKPITFVFAQQSSDLLLEKQEERNDFSDQDFVKATESIHCDLFDKNSRSYANDPMDTLQLELEEGE